MSVAAAIGRSEIYDYVSALFTVYIIVIFIRILLTWIPRMPYNPYLRAAVGFVERTTDPYLNAFRAILRPVGIGERCHPSILPGMPAIFQTGAEISADVLSR